MCPACIASAAMVIASVTSAGGLAAVIAKVRGKSAAKKASQR